MVLTTADISIQLLIDATAALEQISSRIHARAFAAVDVDPTRGPAVRQVPEQVQAVLDATSADGLI